MLKLNKYLFKLDNMLRIIIVLIIIILIVIFNLFVIILNSKIEILGKNIIWLFKKRNNQVVSIYQVSKNYLTKSDEIFKEFFELKRKDFWENSFNIELKDKLNTYKKIHNEINFIFKICEQHKKIYINSKYLYLKDSILDKSEEIWKKLEIYNKIKKEYDFYKKLSNITIIWLFLK